MRTYKFILSAFLIAGFISCGKKTNDADADVRHDEYSSSESPSTAKDTDLINHVYDKFVFAVDSDGNDAPEDYFTENALKKLQDDYEFDCEDGPCYAYYALRTEEQDSNPDSEDLSRIYNIEPEGDGWYIVSYSDMGWLGKTRIRIAGGKIDMYERLER